MHFTAFANAYLLQSIGWAILNSLWQSAVLLILYRLIIFPKHTKALYKYNLSLLFFFTSFAWFIYTIIQTYTALTTQSVLTDSLFTTIPTFSYQQLNVLLPWLSFVYLTVAGIQTIRFIYTYKKTVYLQKSNTNKASLDLRMFTKNIAAHIGIKKEVQIWLSKNIDVPSVIGFIKPVILLPAAIINQLTTQQLEAVLIHELAHIKRNDYLINLVQSVIEITLAFNPFAIILSNHAKKERENCCDDWVLNYQYNQHDYASALLILEEQRRQQLTLAMAATNKKGILLSRVKRMFYVEPQITINAKQKLQLAVVCMLFTAGIFLTVPFTNNTNTSIVLEKTKTGYINKPMAFEYSPANTVEAIPAKFTIETPVKPIAPRKKAIKKAGTTITNDGYTLALINNDLLKQNKKVKLIAASENEIPDSSYYVKIEEQQSGDKQMNVYYFELNKDKGRQTIKPLILMSKPVKDKIKKEMDSTIVIKKRITS